MEAPACSWEVLPPLKGRRHQKTASLQSQALNGANPTLVRRLGAFRNHHLTSGGLFKALRSPAEHLWNSNWAWLSQTGALAGDEVQSQTSCLFLSFVFSNISDHFLLFQAGFSDPAGRRRAQTTQVPSVSCAAVTKTQRVFLRAATHTEALLFRPWSGLTGNQLD